MSFVEHPVVIEGAQINIRFLVLPVSSLPLLLGIDVLMQLNAVTDYKNEILSLEYEDLPIQTQFFSRAMLEGVEENYSDDDFLYYSSHNEMFNIPLTNPLSMYSVDQNDFGHQIAEKFKITTRMTKQQDSEFKLLLCYHENVFANSFKDITGVKDCEYGITLVNDEEKPISTTLRRFSPKEKEIVSRKLR